MKKIEEPQENRDSEEHTLQKITYSPAHADAEE